MKYFRNCRPSAKIFSTNLSPAYIKASIDRSFATEIVTPGGLNVACDTHEASIALVTSPRLAETTHSEPTNLPTACSVRSLPPVNVGFGARNFCDRIKA